MVVVEVVVLLIVVKGIIEFLNLVVGVGLGVYSSSARQK